MRITYDSRARAAYVKLSDGLVFVTREFGPDDRVFLDLDVDANIVGIEILDVDAPFYEQSAATKDWPRRDGRPAARPSSEEASS